MNPIVQQPAPTPAGGPQPDIGFFTTQRFQYQYTKEYDIQPSKPKHTFWFNLMSLLREGTFIGISTVVYSLAFTFVEFKSTGSLLMIPINLVMSLLLAVVLVVGSEILRDIVARLYRLESRYDLWPLGLVLVAFSAYMGNVFAVPGKAYIQTNDRKARGVINAMTPLYSLFISVLIILFVFPKMPKEIGGMLISMSLALGCYEVLPFPPLKGADIWKWNRLAWLLLFLPLYALYVWFVILI